ncbi:beta-1,6-N-acetylglucosaminyltransferase [Empedobacter falsenii]|uniref:Peptide O-xylosyltransferase n=1 Tax=Empedobacter falsenii TaxID=343874 RepID=A0AAW7DF47_9FLAO|nr:beta-1,6-N-acetylglucosaminyltransferase [Empedobacter falsenii]MDM1550508.1 glycosyl transferase [Empedobacter falsenii]
MNNVLNNSTNGNLVLKNSSTKCVNIAYFIMVHRLPNQFKRLFKAIYDPENYYLIHIDNKSTDIIKNDINNFLKHFPNVFIMKSKNVIWGGYSMVQAELDGMKYLLELNIKWDYFINLSGQDYPLKSQNIIRQFLTENKGKNYLKFSIQNIYRPETMNRIENHFKEMDDSISPLTYKRDYMRNTVPYIGGQWMILTRDCCRFICNNKEVKKFEDYYLNTLIPDESFFQTVLMNTSFEGVLINDDKRAIIWIPDGDIKLRPKTFTESDFDFLQLGNNLFARKFDDNVDDKIINIIESFLNYPLSSKTIKINYSIIDLLLNKVRNIKHNLKFSF